MTDSERFYNTVLDLFDDVEEQVEVNELLTWWNRCVIYCSLFDPVSCLYSQVFPSYSSAGRMPCRNSALARIKQKRSELGAIELNVVALL